MLFISGIAFQVSNLREMVGFARVLFTNSQLIFYDVICLCRSPPENKQDETSLSSAELSTTHLD